MLGDDDGLHDGVGTAVLHQGAATPVALVHHPFTLIVQIIGTAGAVLVIADHVLVAHHVVLPQHPQHFVLALLLSHLPDNIDDLLKDKEPNHRHGRHEAEPDRLLVLSVIVVVLRVVLMVVSSVLCEECEEGVRQQMEQCVSSQCPDRQSYEKLTEMMVEDFLHDGNNQDTEHSAE